MNKDFIPFNKPYFIGKELYYIASSVIEHGHISGDGHYTKLCQKWLEEKLGTSKALLTHSCTGALEMTAILADIKPGDEVIMPSYTFVSTANAFVLRGATPVFVDIRPDTLNIDETLIEQAVTGKTKAIVPVHYAGYPCEMDSIMKIAEKHNLTVIEDAAQALLSDYKGKRLGTIGHLGALSFHETKNIISGEGGALLVNNENYIERAEIIWEKGTNRKKFFRGEIDKYTWVDIGSSFLPNEMTAAFLYAQFERAEEIVKKRLEILNLYTEKLQALEKAGHFKMQKIYPDSNLNGHIFFIIVETPEIRSELIKYLKSRNIGAIFHYIPLHSSPAGLKYGRCAGPMDQTDSVSSRIVRLPLYFEMNEEDLCRICSELKNFFEA